MPLQWAVSIADLDAPHFNEWDVGDPSYRSTQTVKNISKFLLPEVLQCNYDKQIARANKQRCHRAVVEEVPEKYIKNRG